MKKLLFIFLLLSQICFAFEPKQDGMYAVIDTDKGEIVIQLEFQKVPITVANFVGLAEGKIANTARGEGVPFYDQLIWHRVEPGKIIQSGCPIGNGFGNPGYNFDNEIDKSLSFDKVGAIAMANYGKNTNGSQFYITMEAFPQWNKQYPVFGYVIEGMDVVSQINQGDKINSVKIIRKGDAASLFSVEQNFTEKNRKKVK